MSKINKARNQEPRFPVISTRKNLAEQNCKRGSANLYRLKPRLRMAEDIGPPLRTALQRSTDQQFSEDNVEVPNLLRKLCYQSRA